MSENLAAPATEPNVTQQFLTFLYGDEPSAYLAIWSLKDRRTWWFAGNELGDAARQALKLAPSADVYFGIGLHPSDRGKEERGTADDVSAIPGLWLDIDIRGPAHKATDLPGSRAEALALLGEFPLEPSAIIDSGHGLQAWWAFKELWKFDNDEERKQAKILAERFQVTLRTKATAHGWNLDATHDIARVLRLPGTFNRKLKPVPVTVIEMHPDRRYDPSDFEGLLIDFPFPLPSDSSGESSSAPSNSKVKLGREALDFVANGAPIGHQRDRAVKAARNYLSAGYTVEQTSKAIWRGLNASPQDPDRKPWTVADARQIAEDLAKKPAPPLKPLAPAIGSQNVGDPNDPRPRIDAGQKDFPVITGQAWDAIRQRNDRSPILFRHGGIVTRLEIDDDGAPIVREVTTEKLRHELARAAVFYVMKERDDSTGTKAWKSEIVKPLVDVVQDMQATRTPPLPILHRITETPVFAPDGTLETSPGYHSASRTYYAPAEGFSLSDVPRNPTAEDLARARRLIFEEVLGDFPFATEADRANAGALALEPYARDLISGPTPNHLIEAPAAGSGKGLLADVLLRPASGRHIGIVAEARDDDEWRKRLTARLREARSVILIDNVTRTLDSGVLAAALTASIWEDRILGRSETIRVPVRCVWVTTANNPTMSTEIARRCVRIRLDPKVDRPWLRDGFRHEDLRQWIDDHRSELVWAALVLIQAWLNAGRPRPKIKALGSYEGWSFVIGGILENAGVQGFLGNLAEFYEVADIEGAVWRAFVANWWEKFADRPVGTADLFPLAQETEGFDIDGKTPKAQQIRFGKQLAKQRDRVIGEYRIAAAGKTQRASQWRLLPLRDLFEAGGEVNVVNVGECFPPCITRESQEISRSEVENVNRVENIHLHSQHSPDASSVPCPKCGDIEEVDLG